MNADEHTAVIEIGGTAIAVTTTNASFLRGIQARYGNFFSTSAEPMATLTIELVAGSTNGADADDSELEVRLEHGEWKLKRGDFRAIWRPLERKGEIRQSANPYSLDCVLRIVHSLVLAREGGFLVHAASAIRSERAYLFCGVSGAGKTTISRFTPPDATYLTDEISYVRPINARYHGFGTPFAGEMGLPGPNTHAEVATVFFLEKGKTNRVEPLERAEALRRFMRNILFFAHDTNLVKDVFEAACRFVDKVPMRRLFFVPDERVWEIIGGKAAEIAS